MSDPDAYMTGTDVPTPTPPSTAQPAPAAPGGQLAASQEPLPSSSATAAASTTTSATSATATTGSDANAGSSSSSIFQYSAGTNAILERMGKTAGAPTWEAARNAVLNTVKTSDSMAPPDSVARPPATQASATTGPGTLRGGRTARGRPARQAAGTSAAAAAGASEASPARSTGRGGGRGGGRRGGRRAGKRRKIKDEDVSSEDHNDEDDEDGGDGSDDDGYTALPAKSRSGRKIQRPTHFDPATKTPSKRRGPYRRVSEAGICRHCGRGAWTAGNKIVFCDGCQAAWHQFCHWPVIGKDVIEEEGREFFCKECVGGKDGDVDLSKLRSGEGMTFEEKKNYLQTVPPPVLVKLLLHASTLQPSLPLFPSPSEPSKSSESLPNGDAAGDAQSMDQASSVAVLYPPAGSGIPLSTDSADLAWLQDSDPEVFSHVYREDMNTDGAGVGVAA